MLLGIAALFDRSLMKRVQDSVCVHGTTPWGVSLSFWLQKTDICSVFSRLDSVF